MLNIAIIKNLINDSSLSDEEIKGIRDELQILAEIILDLREFELTSKAKFNSLPHPQQTQPNN